MKLLWHFIRKDLAALRRWLVAWVAVCLVHFSLRLVQLRGGNEALPPSFASSGRVDFIAIILLLVLIVPQIVQLDPPAQSQAFWKTIPLARQRVLLGKALLILALFVLFPLFLEFTYFTFAGFGATTWPALAAWLRRMLPLVCILAGSAAFAKDRRLAALLIGVIALLLWQSAPQGADLFGGQAGDANQTELWSASLSIWLAVTCLTLLVTQYLLQGRLSWLVVALAFAAAYPLRTSLLTLPAHWSEAALWSGRASAGPPARDPAALFPTPSAEPDKEPSRLIALPPGMSVTIDPIPGYIAFNDTKRHGQLSYVGLRVATIGLPTGVTVSELKLADCRLLLPDRSISAATEEEGEHGPELQRSQAAGPDTLKTMASLKPDATICLPTPLFMVSRSVLEKQPASIEGRLRLKLTRITAAGTAPLRPAAIWRHGLSHVTIEAAQRGESNRESGDGIYARGMLATTLAERPASATRPTNSAPCVAFYLRNDLLGFEERVGLLRGEGPNQLVYGGTGSVTDVTRDRTWQYFEPKVVFDSLINSGNYGGFLGRRFYSSDGDLENWNLALERSEDLGEVELPIQIGPLLPPPGSWSDIPGRQRGSYPQAEDGIVRVERKTRTFRHTLDELRLEDPSQPAAVNEYLHRLTLLLTYAPSALIEYYRLEIQGKLYAVGSENLELLLRFASRLSAPEIERFYGYTFSSESTLEINRAQAGEFLQRVICDLSRPEDKTLVLRYLSPQLDLLDAVEEHGWQAEAREIVNRYALSGSIPERWLEFLAASRDPGVYGGILAQIQHGNCQPDRVLRYGQATGLPERAAAAAAWEGVQISNRRNKIQGDPWNVIPAGTQRTRWMLRLFARGCYTGAPAMPRDLLFALQMSQREWNWQDGFLNKEQCADVLGTMVDVFARYSSCPNEIDEARSWLTANADRLSFNDATHRYELH